MGLSDQPRFVGFDFVGFDFDDRKVERNVFIRVWVSDLDFRSGLDFLNNPAGTEERFIGFEIEILEKSNSLRGIDSRRLISKTTVDFGLA